MRGEVNVTEVRNEPQCTAPAGGLLWRAAGDTNALDVSDRSGTLPHRCCMIARDLSGEERAFTLFSRAARASSGRDRQRSGALGSMRRDTAGLVRGLGRVLCCHVVCRVFEGGGRDAVP
jgi:hypothetical protein